MAMLRHPVTGVLLNRLDLHRKSLDDIEQETARLLRRDGHKIQDIAAMLGTNQGRIAEALDDTDPGDGPDLIGPAQASLF